MQEAGIQQDGEPALPQEYNPSVRTAYSADRQKISVVVLNI